MGAYRTTACTTTVNGVGSAWITPLSGLSHDGFDSMSRWIREQDPGIGDLLGRQWPVFGDDVLLAAPARRSDMDLARLAALFPVPLCLAAGMVDRLGPLLTLRRVGPPELVTGTHQASPTAHGIRGMREGAELYGGVLIARPSKEDGFIVVIRLQMGDAT